MAGEILHILKDLDHELELKYNKFYIGMSKADKPLNFVIFRPKKTYLRVEPKLQKMDEIEKMLESAGLDVLEEESLIREESQLFLDNVPRERLATMLRAHILLRLKNVIITPHCAFNSKESLERLINGTIQNIKAFGAGNPQNVVK
jgi:hypothetical protein